ncbi:MAG: hypothetical protein KDA41_17660, partial [Planctomycetales bacterium]|nr:hypothetical protein [Planctomycetales bacterium]
RVEQIEIDSPLAEAIQPFSIAKTSRHKYLGRRLLAKMEQSPDIFQDAGFHFRLGAAPTSAPTSHAESPAQ